MKYFIAGILGFALFACNVSDKKADEKSTAFAKEGEAAMKDSTKNTTIEWLDPEVQNLGNMNKGQIAEISWRFKNTGNHPLYVTNVHAGCGCTTPDPPKEPIAPGAEGTIKAKFNSSNFTGHVTKEVYV